MGKHQTKNIEDLTPEILVCQASKTAITNEGDNTNPNLFTARTTRSHNTDALTIKLNRLYEESPRCNSHKDFLPRSILEKLFSKGGELNLALTIGIYDQQFIDNRYSNLKDRSHIVMKQIVTYCKETGEKTQTPITETKATLKQQLKKDNYAEIQNIIKANVNETARKQILHERKFKKFNTLKYKAKPTVETLNFTKVNKLLEKSKSTENPTNAKILKATKNLSIRTSKTNLNDYKTAKNIYEELRSLTPTIRRRKQENIPSRNNTGTDMAKDDKYQQEINELKEET